MAKPLVTDELWAAIAPLFPAEPPKPKGGRPRLADRAALTGILFVLRSGITWQMLPQELGCWSGMTCWRRLRDCQEIGAGDLMHFALLDWLAESIRDGLRVRHNHPQVAVRRTPHGSGLRRWRRVVERTFAWLNQFRRLRVRLV